MLRFAAASFALVEPVASLAPISPKSIGSLSAPNKRTELSHPENLSKILWRLVPQLPHAGTLAGPAPRRRAVSPDCDFEAVGDHIRLRASNLLDLSGSPGIFRASRRIP
jgi:hypothetical protein